MSNKVTVTVSEETALELIAIKEQKAEVVRLELKSIQEEIESLKAAIPSNGYTTRTRVRPKIEAQDVAITRNPESGRAPRGASKLAIEKLLEGKPNEELSLNDIAGMTGASSGTAYRILMKMYGDGEINYEQGLWSKKTS